MREQEGIVSRRQVREHGGTDNDIDRMLRRREWARVYPGVYVDHTGSLTWEQWAWAAVLYHWPAALGGESALCAHGALSERSGSQSSEPIELVISSHRNVDPPDGVRVERIVRLDDVTQMNLRPPRARLEFSLLRVASGRDEAGAVAVLANACQRRLTTPARLLQALAPMRTLPQRSLLEEILRDAAEGAYSVLERRHLRDVERAHGLPGAGRQRPGRAASGRRLGSAYRDVEYAAQRTVVELDGRLGHEEPEDLWADMDRDIAAAEERHLTVRVGWRQVSAPCRLAGAVGRILAARGWDGAPVACSAGCPVGKTEGKSAKDADDPSVSGDREAG